MAAPSSHDSLRALPDWSAVPSNSEEDRVLLNRRIAYFGGVIFLLSGAFYAFNATLCLLLLEEWLAALAHPSMMFHLTATLVFGLEWLLCRRYRRSSGELNLIDVGGLLLAMLLFAAMTSYEPHGVEQVFILDVIIVATLTTHAVIVPATARRTLWVSLVAAAPAPATAFFIATRVPSANSWGAEWFVATSTAYATMWALLAVAISTLASRIIYGLQQRVREATELGQYTLEEKIGEGGMGIVYRARHTLLRRPTAVKLLPREKAGERNIRRFEREVQLTSGLTHPNTIAIYDYGHTPDGVFYYAMEYIEGITLDELVEQAGPQSPARVVHILTQVCAALVEAHACGLVHRDIKPANVMLCVRGLVPDSVKVLDFGLVKDRAVQDPNVSASNVLVGTPLYLAPEAIADPSTVDARTDLYALGAVGYFLLTGKPVFEGRSIFEVCSKHLTEEPVPLSVRSGKAIPEGLERTILSCLAKDPARRPSSAAELATLLNGVETPDVWSAFEAEAWWSERAADVMRGAKSRRSRPAPSGPRTVAIDLDRRATTSAVSPLDLDEAAAR